MRGAIGNASAPVAIGILLASPFWAGAIRVARYLGFELGRQVFPEVGSNKVDLAAAPRRLFVATLQLTIVIAVGAPLVAITQPFLPPFVGPIVLLLIIGILAISFCQPLWSLNQG